MGTALDKAVGGHTQSGRTPRDRGGWEHEHAGRRYMELALRACQALPKQRNGRPSSLSDRYADQVKREWQQGRSVAFKRERAFLVTLVRDGVPLSIALAPLHQMTAEIEAEGAVVSRTHDRPIVPLLRRETRAQATLDLAQIRVVHEPNSPEALTEALRAADQYAASLDDFTGAVVRALVAVEGPDEKGRRTEVRAPLRSRPRVSATSNALQDNTCLEAAALGVSSSTPSSALVAGGAL